ncbi:uncharacterized protein LOC125334101 [Corvus hawaiiensis]|uniref:uncharacterized protein LOC125334101 n=1 Tax=Corvus hawaiiensis TaxID=134902 RepID=UPI00201866F8|nr:uncharacterized protein LOC125334101 [Corvus hawaiiensis]
MAAQAVTRGAFRPPTRSPRLAPSPPLRGGGFAPAPARRPPAAEDMVNWLAGGLMRRNLPRDIVKRWELLPVACHGKGKMRSAATETRNSSSKPGTSAWKDAALVLLWLKEAQPHIIGHPAQRHRYHLPSPTEPHTELGALNCSTPVVSPLLLETCPQSWHCPNPPSVPTLSVTHWLYGKEVYPKHTMAYGGCRKHRERRTG